MAATYCPAAALEKDLEITIHVYDYYGAQPSVRTDAQQSVETIFHQAGVTIRWQDCLSEQGKRAVVAACGAGTLDVTHIVLSVLPESMSAKIATNSEQFGTSVSGRADGFPTQAYIFMDRVVHFAASAKMSQSNLLGMVAAHEIGHLLLGSNSHSAAGIMRGKWATDELQGVLAGALSFTPRQSELMRAGVRRRMAN